MHIHSPAIGGLASHACCRLIDASELIAIGPGNRDGQGSVDDRSS